MVRASIGLHHIDTTMVIAVVAMWMVKAPIDEIVDVVTVRDRFVAAAGTVEVSIGVRDVIDVRATAGVFGSDREDVFFDRTVGILVMEMAVVNVVDVVTVLNGRVTAIFPVLMRMGFVGVGF